ncbi:hypothetical protein DYB37_013967, partial [Aphanomyces astaci]
FVGCFATVRSKLTSGESDGPEDAELVRRAKELFANKADARGKQSRFLFLHAWEILRTVPKWQDLRSQQPGNDRAKKRMKLDENDDIVSDDDVRQRPLGVKASKKLKASRHHGGSEVQKTVADAQLLRANAMLLQAELSLMTVPLTGLSDTAKEFVLLKQAKVLSKEKVKIYAPTSVNDEYDSMSDNIVEEVV